MDDQIYHMGSVSTPNLCTWTRAGFIGNNSREEIILLKMKKFTHSHSHFNVFTFAMNFIEEPNIFREGVTVQQNEEKEGTKAT